LVSSASGAAIRKRESRGTRSLLIEWTLEAVVNGEGYRVVGSGREGTMQIPKAIADNLPAVGTLRMSVLNANGKVRVVGDSSTELNLTVSP